MIKALGWAVVFLLMIGIGVTLGYGVSMEPEPGPVVYRDRLVVPQPCVDAMDHGDELVQLTGEAVGAAARKEDDLLDLVQRATRTVDEYQSAARRCRALR